MIRNTLISALLAAAFIPATAMAAELAVEVDGIETAGGMLHVAIFDEDGWSDNEAVDGRVVDASTGTVRVVFDGLAPGRYGVKLYHDADGNGELNRGLMGIPSEPYGFSNNASAQFGPPKFGAAAFDLAEPGTVQTIGLH